MTAESVDLARSPHRFVSRLLAACIVVLILAQALIGALSLSALSRLTADNTADRFELSVRQTAAHLQTGLNLGKPLAQYFGLDTVLSELHDRVPGMAGASVVLPDGTALASLGRTPDPGAVLAALNGQRTADASAITVTRGMARQWSREYVRLAISLSEPDSAASGALIVDVAVADAAHHGLLVSNVATLAFTTLGAALALIVLLRYVMPSGMLARHAGLRKLIPVLVLLLAQGIYAAITIDTFRKVWLDVTHDNAVLLAQGVQRDLDTVLSYGIAPDKMVGIEPYMARVMQAFPIIQELRLRRADGSMVARADINGERAPTTRQAAVSGKNAFSLPLHADKDAPPLAYLEVILNERRLQAGVRNRVLDAATVGVVALVAAMELLRLLELLLGDRALAKRRSGMSVRSVLGDPRMARPIMFGFLFAWALPLGFLPLYARSLAPPDTAAASLPLLMALPITVEMAFGLVTALLAGRLSDRHGWQRPVLMGLFASVAGYVLCALVSSVAGLIAARAVVGAGYGLAWMGLQGFVVLNSPASHRARNISSVIAGIYAGHLSGAAVGAMLMQQLGAPAVFYTGALLFCLPLVAVAMIARAQRAFGEPLSLCPENGPSGACVAAAPAQRPGWRSVLFSRGFGVLLFASVVPFSVAQVGLLSFALPLYMESSGAQTASVGRVLMAYGLCIIYLGPLMGRWADGSRHKKYWIVASGLVGSAGMLGLSVLSGVSGALVAVLCMALAGCLAGGAQTAYMLAQDPVHRYGMVGATSLMRAADKVGQMLGPLLVAALFTAVSISAGLVVIGALYLLASVVFMRAAPRDMDRPDTGAAPGR